MKLTILTPTYNRSFYLSKLYKSLLKQDNKDQFVWMIVDDGSSDDTRQYITDLKKDGLINIEYIYKKNGGKHTAINKAYAYLNSEYVMIVDSDDYLKENAISQILTDWETLENNCDVNAVFYLRGYENGEVIGQSFPNEGKVLYLDYMNMRVSGDKLYVFRSEFLKKYPFPVFENENFLGEVVVWGKMALDGTYIYLINKILYITEYLENGLTKSGRYLRLKNINGSICYADTFLNHKFSLFLRVKCMLLSISYEMVKKDTIKFCYKYNMFLSLLLYIPSIFLYFHWKGIIKKHEIDL